MKFQFWTIGKNNDKTLQGAIEDYTNRINRYYPVEWKLFSPAKTLLPPDLHKKEEASQILQQLQKEDYLVLLDERGKMLGSDELAKWIGDRANASVKRIVFLIGGAYGVDESIMKRANFTWSFSRLVFPHQLMRLMLSEQIYRACTILNNEKYHHS